MSLYNEERPFDFSSVKGQDNIVKIISNDLVKGTIKGAYLFSGVRGTGKTSIARIFAGAVNCSHPKEDGSPCGECVSCREIRNGTNIDVFELDAASNNSVEDVRNILEKVQYKPLRQKKVFIFDECHMLSTAANNALLKTLEEPPADVIFIMCTTERHKVPATIVSRCSCYDFEKISVEKISNHLAEICTKRHTSIEQDAIRLIAKAANGAMRDALSILDKFITMDHVSVDIVATSLGMTSDDTVFSILSGIADKNALKATDSLKAAVNRGCSLSFLIEKIFEVLLDMVDFQSTGDISNIIGTTDYKDSLTELSYILSTETAFQIMNEFRKVYQLRSDTLELSFIAAIISVIYEESSLISMKQEIEQLRAELNALKASLINDASVQKESSLTVADSLISDNNSSDVVRETDTNVQNVSMPVHVPEDSDFDSDFCYDEEEIPCFDSEDYSSKIPPTSNQAPQNSADSSIEETCPVEKEISNTQDELLDGMPLDELIKMADEYDLANDNVIEENSVNESTEASREEPSFFGDLFSDAFARQC